ncbi:uncharacterized protein [Palaemon carinicauda]|uniref:uncharacterized protein n=1 Tax=Palaemon carinicauda TaxID=392227 RepID=UPI0035B62ADB
MAKDYWKSRRWKLCIFLLFICDAHAVVKETKPEIRKRQIYREGVLPAQGGVLPEGAFTKQRLKQNIHDTLGVEAPDGFLFLVRESDVRPIHQDPEDQRDILTLTRHRLQPHTAIKGVVPVRPQPTTYLLRRPTTDDLRPLQYAATQHQGPPLLFSNTAHHGWNYNPFPDQFFISHFRSSSY